MSSQPPSEPTNPRFYIPRPSRQRVSTTDLMRGGRMLIMFHEGKEYMFRITKTGKLILTK